MCNLWVERTLQSTEPTFHGQFRICRRVYVDEDIINSIIFNTFCIMYMYIQLYNVKSLDCTKAKNDVLTQWHYVTFAYIYVIKSARQLLEALELLSLDLYCNLMRRHLEKTNNFECKVLWNVIPDFIKKFTMLFLTLEFLYLFRSTPPLLLHLGICPCASPYTYTCIYIVYTYTTKNPFSVWWKTSYVKFHSSSLVQMFCYKRFPLYFRCFRLVCIQFHLL